VLLKLVSRIEIETKNEIFSKIIQNDFCTGDFLNIDDKGALINNIESDSTVISNLINQNIGTIISVFNVIVTGLILIGIEFRLTIILLMILPINGYIFLRAGIFLKAKEHALRIFHDKYIVFLTEAFNAIDLYSIFGVKKKVIDAFKIKNEEIYNIGISKYKTETRISIFTDFISSFSNIIVLGLGIYLIYKKELTVGMLVAFNSYSNSFKNELHEISKVNLIFQNMIVSLERIMYIFNETSTKDTILLNDEIRSFEFKNLKFRYGDRYIFKGNTFSFKRGNMYYISGKSGIGKTTLLNILSGVERNISADIFINGLEVLDFSLFLDEYIYIDQKNSIFTDTIYNNIALYRNIERNRVEEICDLLEIDNVIKGLSEGYDTIINSKGVDLSEGQKQRICIARGLVDEGKSVYIFDEIISSLDKTISEKIILYLKKISNNSIVIISSHKDLKDVTDVVEYSLL